MIFQVSEDRSAFWTIGLLILGGFLLSNNISCYLRPKAGLLKRGALFTHIHFAGDQTLLSYIEPFPVGMLLA